MYILAKNAAAFVVPSWLIVLECPSSASSTTPATTPAVHCSCYQKQQLDEGEAGLGGSGWCTKCHHDVGGGETSATAATTYKGGDACCRGCDLFAHPTVPHRLIGRRLIHHWAIGNSSQRAAPMEQHGQGMRIW
jgi:hypothetical protein